MRRCPQCSVFISALLKALFFSHRTVNVLLFLAKHLDVVMRFLLQLREFYHARGESDGLRRAPHILAPRSSSPTFEDGANMLAGCVA